MTGRGAHDETRTPAPPPGARGLRSPGAGEDPIVWSFPLIPGVLRVHALVPIWIGAELVTWLRRDAVGLVHVVAVVTSLLVIAAFRELFRASVARRLGCESAPSVLWPLGGLSPTPISPGGPSPLAECGGLVAGVLLVPALGSLVLASGASPEALLPSPLDPRITAAGLRSTWQVWAWWAYYANLIMLAANLLLPMSAFDAGRVVQSWARRARDDYRALALRIGLFAALAVFVIGASAGETRLMAVAALGGLATYLDTRRLEFIALGTQTITVRDVPAERPAPDVSLEAEPAPPPDLDDVLARISRDGMASLTPQERRVLERETERRRRR
ncbi:MAG: hypothetical protein SFY69_10855 [Planctomycetota bacterium]|nr:hypothetical protein [Planctomycetota bacterium]